MLIQWSKPLNIGLSVMGATEVIQYEVVSEGTSYE